MTQKSTAEVVSQDEKHQVTSSYHELPMTSRARLMRVVVNGHYVHAWKQWQDRREEHIHNITVYEMDDVCKRWIEYRKQEGVNIVK